MIIKSDIKRKYLNFDTMSYIPCASQEIELIIASYYPTGLQDINDIMTCKELLQTSYVHDYSQGKRTSNDSDYINILLTFLNLTTIVNDMQMKAHPKDMTAYKDRMQIDKARESLYMKLNSE